MRNYLDILRGVMLLGETREDRTGVGTISIFGVQSRYDLTENFPAVTTKKLAWKSVVSELLWFLEGSTDERRLAEIHYQKSREEIRGKKTIWTANADAQGVALGYENSDDYKELGPVYGHQWRFFGATYDENDLIRQNGVDQIKTVVDQLVNSPDSRRIILSAWAPTDIPLMALPPCHVMCQFYVNSRNELSCHLYQRSADLFLGVPFNIASYALLTCILANHVSYITGKHMSAGELVHTIGDAHVYMNHVEQVDEQLSRDTYDLPVLNIKKDIASLDIEWIQNNLSVDDFELVGYRHHDAINAPMAV